jgi:diadenosine tetraphosphate (Ap4A) HIT family hydrolase
VDDPDCLVCRQLRSDFPVPGGFLLAGDAVAAFHAPPLDDRPRPYLGHLLVCTRRHADGWEALTAEEAAAVGRAARALAAALRRVRDLERVYTATVGHRVAHFHLDLLPRYAGTPHAVPWYAVDAWQGGPHGGADETAVLSEELRTALEAR